MEKVLIALVRFVLSVLIMTAVVYFSAKYLAPEWNITSGQAALVSITLLWGGSVGTKIGLKEDRGE